MTSINNIHEYKKAKLIVQDLSFILDSINMLEKSLKQHNKYSPVKSILSEVTLQKSLLIHHLNRYKKIIENKGLVDG